jgi:hypothetical protein
VRYEERGQGYRDVEKVGKYCCRETCSKGKGKVITMHDIETYRDGGRGIAPLILNFGASGR